MSDLSRKREAFGILERLWQARADDYAVCAAWHPDGETLFVGDAGGVLSAYDVSQGRRRWSTRAHPGGILAMAMHPAQSVLATAGQDGVARLWNTDIGRSIHELVGDAAWVEHLAWAPDGQHLASASGRHLRVWDLGGRLLARSAAHASAVSAVLWSNERELVTACYGRVSFWDAASGRLQDKLDWKGSLVSMVMSPDGAIIACGSQDNTVHFWRRETKQDSMMSGYPNKPKALAFDRTSTFLATSGSEAVTVWNFQGSGPEGSVPNVLAVHVLPVTTLQFARRRARLASGAKDGGVLIWDLNHDGGGDPVGGGIVTGPVESVTWRHDDRLLAAIDADGGISVWHCGQ